MFAGRLFKGGGEGGAFAAAENKAGGSEAGQIRNSRPPPAARARQNWRPACTLPQPPRPPAFATRLVTTNDGKSEAFKWLPNPPGNRD